MDILGWNLSVNGRVQLYDAGGENDIYGKLPFNIDHAPWLYLVKSEVLEWVISGQDTEEIIGKDRHTVEVNGGGDVSCDGCSLSVT